MTNVLQVVKSGKKIDSPSLDDFLYTSQAVSPKVYKKVTGVISTNSSGAGTVFIDHDLGYAPINLTYINPTISLVNTNFPMGSSWGLVDNNFSFASSNPTNIRLDIQSGVANAQYNYVCFIFVEPINDPGN